MLCLWFQALELDQSNEKALFRRGEALFNMNEFDRAKNDFQQVVQLYPANKAAKSQVRISLFYKWRQFKCLVYLDLNVTLNLFFFHSRKCDNIVCAILLRR